MLHKRRVLVTRPEPQASRLCLALEHTGYIGVPLPLIAIEPYHRPENDSRWHTVAAYDWILFTSANGVAHAWEQSHACAMDTALRDHQHIAVVGPATARAVTTRGGTVRHIAPTHIAESLADQLGDVRGQRILWPRAYTTRDVLGTTLRARGAEVDEVIVYRTVPATLPADAADRVRDADVATFASPSAIQQFIIHFGATAAKQTICIGPITAAAARAAGMHVHAIATSYTADGLLDALSQQHV